MTSSAAHEIGKAMRGFQADEQVNVIRNSTDALWETAQAGHGSALVLQLDVMGLAGRGLCVGSGQAWR